MLHAWPVTPTETVAVTGVPPVQAMLAELTEGLADVNGVAAVTVTVLVLVAPAATVPMFQVIVPLLFEQLLLQLLNDMPDGNVSVRTTLAAEASP